MQPRGVTVGGVGGGGGLCGGTHDKGVSGKKGGKHQETQTKLKRIQLIRTNDVKVWVKAGEKGPRGTT